MKPDDFEPRLQRQTLRAVPREWRAEILARANAAARASKQREGDSSLGAGLNSSRRRQWASTVSGYLSLVTSAATRMGRELIWPNPRAWAGLAAVWIVIFALKLSTENEGRIAGNKSSATPEVIAELRQQKLLFAELIGEVEVRDAKPPKRSPPRPRSERSGETRAA